MLGELNLFTGKDKKTMFLNSPCTANYNDVVNKM